MGIQNNSLTYSKRDQINVVKLEQERKVEDSKQIVVMFS